MLLKKKTSKTHLPEMMTSYIFQKEIIQLTLRKQTVINILSSLISYVGSEEDAHLITSGYLPVNAYSTRSKQYFLFHVKLPLT